MDYQRVSDPHKLELNFSPLGTGLRGFREGRRLLRTSVITLIQHHLLFQGSSGRASEDLPYTFCVAACELVLIFSLIRLKNIKKLLFALLLLTKIQMQMVQPNT